MSERGSPKYEKAALLLARYEEAALRWLERYLTEGEPRLQHFAEIVADRAKLEALDR